MRELSDHGVGILMISSDMEEVIGVSDRVAVMHEGRIAGFLERGELSEQTHPVARRRKERDIDSTFTSPADWRR